MICAFLVLRFALVQKRGSAVVRAITNLQLEYQEHHGRALMQELGKQPLPPPMPGFGKTQRKIPRFFRKKMRARYVASQKASQNARTGLKAASAFAAK